MRPRKARGEVLFFFFCIPSHYYYLCAKREVCRFCGNRETQLPHLVLKRKNNNFCWQKYSLFSIEITSARHDVEHLYEKKSQEKKYIFFSTSVLAQGKKKKRTCNVANCLDSVRLADTPHVNIRFISLCCEALMTRFHFFVNISCSLVLVHSVIIFVSSSFWWPLHESL